MANGKVFPVIKGASSRGSNPDDILDGGQFLIVWDSTSNAFSQLTTPGKGDHRH